MLVEDHKLEAIIKLPSGVFRPYAGVSCAIVIFTKTGVGGTENVWFYDMTADGFSLDDKRTPLLVAGKLGPVPEEALTEDEHARTTCRTFCLDGRLWRRKGIAHAQRRVSW